MASTEQWTEVRLATATAEEIVAARQAGLLQDVLSGKTHAEAAADQAAEQALQQRRQAEQAAYDQLQKLHAALGDDFFAQTGIVLPHEVDS